MDNLGNIVNALICVGLIIVIAVTLIVNHLKVQKMKDNYLDRETKKWENEKKQQRKDEFLKKIDEMKKRDNDKKNK